MSRGTPAVVLDPNTGSIFDRYSIKLQEQSRAALRRTTDYTRQLGTQPTVVPLADRRADVRP